MEIYTIGFTKRTAAEFFETLKTAQITRLVDVRLNNSSQLAAFAKRDDLRYFLRQICNADYCHEQLLAPTQNMLDDYKKNHSGWNSYADRFLSLLKERQIETKLDPVLFAGRAVLLCSEHSAEHCHRRLVAEYLASKWKDVSIKHL